MANLHRRLFVIALLAFSVALQSQSAPQHEPCCGPVTDSGHRLALNLNSMNVESLWLAGKHVDWETGEPDRGGDYEGPGNHSHCSAFAAAAAKSVGVYLLRPPEHGLELLANAQAKWLRSEAGMKAGWRKVADMREAQRLANQGSLVVVVFEDPDPHVPGHIAIVRPSEKTLALLEENGPDVIMAGEHNYTKISVRIGFRNHPGVFPDGVRYYAHPLTPHM